MKKLLALAVVILGFTAVSFGQLSNTATATASAKILTALTIEKKVDLDFGTIGAKTTPTIAKINTAGLRTGSTTDLIATGLGAAAEFEIKGDKGSLFSITYPSTDTNLSSGASPAMKIHASDWVSKIDGGAETSLMTGSIDASGVTVLKVGATLQVAASQPSGSYSGPFSVTVNYN